MLVLQRERVLKDHLLTQKVLLLFLKVVVVEQQPVLFREFCFVTKVQRQNDGKPKAVCLVSFGVGLVKETCLEGPTLDIMPSFVVSKGG